MVHQHPHSASKCVTSLVPKKSEKKRSVCHRHELGFEIVRDDIHFVKQPFTCSHDQVDPCPLPMLYKCTSTPALPLRLDFITFKKVRLSILTAGFDPKATFSVFICLQGSTDDLKKTNKKTRTQHVVQYLNKDISNDGVLFEKSRGRFSLVRRDGNTRGYLRQPASVPARTGRAVLRLASKEKQGESLRSEAAVRVDRVQQLACWTPPSQTGPPRAAGRSDCERGQRSDAWSCKQTANHCL